MATKTGILATINGFITAVITQAKHRSSMSTLVDEIYPSRVVDTQATETYTTKSGTNITYSINIIKSGNIAHIKGSINNVTGLFLTPQTVFTFKENEFKPLNALNSVIYFTATNASATIRMSLDSTGLSTFSTMPNQEFNFEFIAYITQP
jgi:hypothetical protein